MWSSTSRASLIAAALCAAGCTQDPSLLVEVTRTGTADALITVCATGSASCTGMVKAFGTSSAASRSVGIYVQDSTTAITVQFQVIDGSCVALAVDLADGPVDAAYRLDGSAAPPVGSLTCSDGSAGGCQIVDCAP